MTEQISRIELHLDKEVKEAYERKRRDLARFFVPSHLLPGTSTSIVSPSGKYSLSIEQYARPGSWELSRGIVRRIDDSTILADVKRNYGHFPYRWVEHANGNEYLTCGEDYQGYTVINLTLAITHIYFPAEGLPGFGYCWVELYPSPDTRLLAVDGCVWGAPYEIRFYDFSNPDDLPFRELGRIETTDKVIGWESNEQFAVTQEYEYRISDGARYSALSEEEQNRLDSDRSSTGWASEIVRWQRSSKAT